MRAAINHRSFVHHHATRGPYNPARLLTFLGTLQNLLIPPDQIDGPEQLRHVDIWDNASFHQAALLHNCFVDHPRRILHSSMGFFFSACRWKVYASYGRRMW